MRKMIIPLILFSLMAFGCVLNFDQNDTSSDSPRPLEPQVPVTPDVPGEGAEGDLPHTESTPMEEGKFAESSNAFAFDIYNRVAEADQDQNVFFSPYSIYTALGMVYGGARRATEEQMRKALYFDADQTAQHTAFMDMSKRLNEIGKRDKAQLHVANGAFQAKMYEDLLLPEYQDLLEKYYDSEMYSLDFGKARETAAYINEWVLERTNKRIKDLVNEQHIRDSNHGMILVNAIFFKANWLKQFNPKSTEIMSFYPNPEKETPVNMMYARGTYAYTEVADMQVIELPYDEEELSMLVFLPIAADQVPKLNNDILYEALKTLDKQDVRLWMPSFTLELELDDVAQMLKHMGMEDAFDEVKADFSGIRDPRSEAGLYIRDILHKAFIEVNEEGTEAAAATGVVMATRAMAMPDEEKPIIFRADHPFSYMIVHRPSQTILFMGRLSDPPIVE